jgi:hypothetical protein
MASALAGDRDGAADETFRSTEAALLSHPVDGESLKPRQLRDAFECPFRFFARHRLNLYGGRANQLWSRLYALPGSVLLATIPSRESALTQLKQALDAELDNVVADVEEWQIGVVKAGGERLIEEWVEREFAAREKWPSDPGSLRTNVSFGSEDLKGSLKTLAGDKVVLNGMLSSISYHRNVRVGHLYRRSQFRVECGNKFELNGDVLELGTYLAALFERGKGAALDVESLSDRRMIYITDFENPLDKFESDKETGLEVKPLGPPHVFIEQIRQGLGQAMSTVLKAKTITTPGDHCKRCDMGELCRKSSEFSEEESPFGDE